MLLCAEDADGNLALMTPERICPQVRKFANPLGTGIFENPPSPMENNVDNKGPMWINGGNIVDKSELVL